MSGILHNAIKAYRDKYIITGSSKPLIHVLTYVGSGMFFVECTHHYFQTRAARAYTATLEGYLEIARGELRGILARRDEQAEIISEASRRIQEATSKLRGLELELPTYEAKVKEAEERLEKHKASIH
uniref:Uncharacterized protein n=1 Tax=Tetraselmis sp. GSL018 TaxID=582737 RepID=A0A061SCA5_9CHLO|eukprot:CAMPEP_0177589480 /NCGR_PEP_ID=MMETSP0419_2-20121207/6828_1 /TAXON_ID=582737 /ORGANISM="Tetraselmis sp., Strain GSL018" /LENGTH=126 /DNA_ID=CAMNT_0019079841 /DNA_START=76 /DNA_END=456 /DNA_ORIENTATION=-